MVLRASNYNWSADFHIMLFPVSLPTPGNRIPPAVCIALFVLCFELLCLLFLICLLCFGWSELCFGLSVFNVLTVCCEFGCVFCVLECVLWFVLCVLCFRVCVVFCTCGPPYLCNLQFSYMKLQTRKSNFY